MGSDNTIKATFKVDTTGVLAVGADGTLTIDLSGYALGEDLAELEDRVSDLETALTWGAF